MSHPWIVVIAVLALAALYVLLPLVAHTFRRYRSSRMLRCPETGGKAEVGVDAPHAAFTSAFGRAQLRAEDCSLWPEKKDCGQECLTFAEVDRPEPVQLQAR